METAVTQDAVQQAAHAVQEAHDELARLYDQDRPAREIREAEARLAEAETALVRAQRAAESQDRKETATKLAVDSAARKLALEAFNQVLAERIATAQQLDRHAAAMAAAVAKLDSLDDAVREGQRRGFATNDINPAGRGRLAATMALGKAGAIAPQMMGDPVDHPNASSMVLRDNDALTASVIARQSEAA